MHELALPEVITRIGECLAKKDIPRAGGYLWPALDQYYEHPILWFFAGNIFYIEGKLEPAVQAFRRSVDLDYNPHVLANLGAAYKRLNRYDAGMAALTQAVRDVPDNFDALVNLGGMYVNEGNPLPGIEILERAKKVEKLRPDGKSQADWNLSLLHLEAGHYAKGFDLYRAGVHQERRHRSYTAPTEGFTAHAPEPLFYQPGMPRKGKTIIVWGEQGMGDELMFGSCLNDALDDFGEVIFECHPRLMKIQQRRWPNVRMFPTRKEEVIRWPVEENIVADYKCPIGDLAALYRRERVDFDKAWAKYGPFYSADPEQAADYRARLVKLAKGRPIVGLAIRGGTMLTARSQRTMGPLEAKRLIQGTEAFFVSLDYEDMTTLNQWLAGEVGPDRYTHFPAIARTGTALDYDPTASLVAACDMVVSVCQTVAHLAASMGKQIRVLTPKRVAWRYGLTEEAWVWYPHPYAKLYRGENWERPIDRVIADIKQLC